MTSPNKTQDTKDWVGEYKDVRPSFERFTGKLRTLVEDLLANEEVKIQTIESRTKTVDSFAEKIRRPGKSYRNPIKDLSDLTGLMILLYYQDHVDTVCALLDREFTIDEGRSVDKRRQLSPDQFGYVSVHKVVTLSPARAALSEWSAYKEMVAEIQVRTVLQHAWASISHTLQYKREAEVPMELRRKLTRLSGLLELADEEFVELRQNQSAFTREVTDRLSREDLSLEIDSVSVLEYLHSSEPAMAIAGAALGAGFSGVSGEGTKEVQLVRVCKILELQTIAALDKELRRVQRHAVKFYKEFARLQPELVARGHAEHWASVLLVGSRFAHEPTDKIRASVPWGEEYLESCLKAARAVFS